MGEQSECVIRDFLFDSLRNLIGDANGSSSKTHFPLKSSLGKSCEVEGKVQYCLPSGRCLTHKCDLLLTLHEKRFMGVEIKFRSAVSDQFKCRAFDMMNIKEKLGEKFLAVMVYVHVPGAGIGIDLARDYCHPFDLFIGREARGLQDLTALESIAAEIRDSIIAQAGRRVAAAARAV